MSLNITKTKLLTISKQKKEFITFTANDLNIEIIQNVKILGIYVNSNFTWDLHFHYLRKTFARKLHILRFLRNGAPLFTNVTCKLNNLLNQQLHRAHNIIYLGLGMGNS